MTTRHPLILMLGAALLGLAACESGFKAPTDPGVCYYVVPAEDGKSDPRLNVVARNQPNLEQCAARLEEMRVRFLRMGGSNAEIVGAYQGRFLFIDRRGVYSGAKLEGGIRYAALARTGDGRLAIPGAIVRDENGRPVAVAAPSEPSTEN